MKRIFKRNQVVLTLLAVMIAVAGYLNYTADTTAAGSLEASSNQAAVKEMLEISDEDLLLENLAASGNFQIYGDTAAEAPSGLEIGAESADEAKIADPIDEVPGTAVLTGSGEILEYVASVQLSREQTRARNKETLLTIINSDRIGEEQKQEAVNSMVLLTEISEKETAAETLLAAKGYEHAIVYINEDSVDVVINRNVLSDAERAQVEDIVKRKTECTIDQIVITLLDREK